MATFEQNVWLNSSGVEIEEILRSRQRALKDAAGDGDKGLALRLQAKEYGIDVIKSSARTASKSQAVASTKSSKSLASSTRPFLSNVKVRVSLQRQHKPMH